MRVLLFAHGRTPEPFREADDLPALPPGVKPVAWLGFTDELRPNVDKALNGFRDAGITLKVISGDNPETVAALARQAGLSGDAVLVSGLDLDGMDESQFMDAAERSLSTLNSGTRRCSQLSRKCTASPVSSAAPVFGNFTSSA